MKIGIIGAGMIGGTLGRLWMTAGHDVAFGTRHPETVNIGGATSDAVETVAAWSDVLLLAVPLGATPAVARAIAGYANGKVIMDAGNVYPERDPAAARDIATAGTGSGVWVAKFFPTSQIVKAFNTVYFKTLIERAGDVGDPLGIPLAGDHREAVARVEGLVRDAGFEPVAFGALAEAREFDAGTPGWNTGESADALRRRRRA